MYHKTCGNGLAIDITDSLKIICSAGITRKTLTAGTAQIINVAEEIKTKFYCQGCGKNVSKEEIYFTCTQCNEKITTTKAFIIQGSGGIYCEEHAKSNADNNSRKVFCIDPILDVVTI